MENPYQSPQEPCGGYVPGDPFRRAPGLVHHVRAVAILMLIQGGLETLTAVMYGVLAVVLPQLMATLEVERQSNSPSPNQMFWSMAAMYGGQGTVALIAAILHITAGVQNCRFRGRTLGIIALIGGMMSAATCYCLPTTVALGIYGLIVYLNREATEGFKLGTSGQTTDQILNTFR